MGSDSRSEENGGWNAGGPLRGNDVRARNEKLILELIQSRGELSQSEASHETGLRPPTVFRIFTNLERQAFIVEADDRPVDSERRGRRPVYYAVNRRARYAIGVDLWSGSVAATLMDFARDAVVSNMEILEPGKPIGEVLAQVEQVVERLIERAAVDRARLLGIGIGVPGVIDLQGGIVESYDRIPGMSNTPVAARLSEHFSVPVLMHNNTTVIAGSEYRYGTVQGSDSVMAILIRSGVGGAFLQKGQPFTSRGRTAVELGHTIVDPDAHAMGRSGTLESLVNEDELFVRLESACGVADRQALIQRLADGNEAAVQALVEPAESLGAAIISLSNLFNPSVFLVIARFAVLSRYLAREAERYARRDVPGTLLEPAEIRSCEYDPLRACRGAADLVFDRFFSSVND
ncbi:MAG: ROK family protein [Spirochaetales bacterium]